MRADVRRDVIIHYCFEIWAGVADTPREISEQCQTGTSSRESFTRSPIAAIFSVNDFPTLLIFLVHQCVDYPSTFLSSPKQEEGIGRVKFSWFIILPRRLTVCPQPLSTMDHYIISRAGAEGEAAWSFSRQPRIRWDRPNIWWVPMGPYVCD